MSDAIVAHDLRKTFGKVVALDGLNLQVGRGEVHGFLGPNGAGKSTTLRVLLGLLRPDGGSARVLAADPWADAETLHRRMAYIPGDVVLWPNLTGGEVIDLMGRLGAGHDEVRLRELIERFDLDVTKRSRTYSKGNRQKVALVAALASRAELLLLDEPTSGLDPLMERVFREEVARLKAEGRTVLLSSHILSEVEATCDRVSIVRAGRIVDSGTLEDLRRLTRSTVRARLGEVPAADQAAAWPGVADVVLEVDTLTCTVDADNLQPLLEQLTRRRIHTLVCQPPSLEDVFLQRYRGASDHPSAASPGPSSGTSDSDSVGAR